MMAIDAKREQEQLDNDISRHKVNRISNLESTIQELREELTLRTTRYESVSSACDTLQAENERLKTFINTMVVYLDTHKETTIGHKSIFHQEMRDAIKGDFK